jgi:hypothetical protein
MFGLGILVVLGRRLAAATLADTGLLPAGFYRHLALAALEEEDFSGAIKWLPFAGDPVLIQLLVLRLRLLAARHDEQRQAVIAMLDQDLPPHLKNRGQDLLDEENKALELLSSYMEAALELLEGYKGHRPKGRGPSERNNTAAAGEPFEPG